MLLEYIYKHSGVLYMSDLKVSDKWRVVVLCIISDEQLMSSFSLKDWQDALAYLKGEQLASDNPQDIIDRLLQN